MNLEAKLSRMHRQLKTDPKKAWQRHRDRYLDHAADLAKRVYHWFLPWEEKGYVDIELASIPYQQSLQDFDDRLSGCETLSLDKVVLSFLNNNNFVVEPVGPVAENSFGQMRLYRQQPKPRYYYLNLKRDSQGQLIWTIRGENQHNETIFTRTAIEQIIDEELIEPPKQMTKSSPIIFYQK